MKIVISGGSGYIGARLVQQLDLPQNQILVLARNKPDWFPDRGNIVFRETDITHPIEIEMDDAPHIFIHLAAANDITSRDSRLALATTVFGTRNVLDFCLNNGIPKFIYFSTFQVYGELAGHLNEQTPPNPKNDYAITHLDAETYVELYYQREGLNYLILRPTNIYGAPVNKSIQRWTLVPNCFCLEAFEYQKITLRSSGKQKRDFLNLEDVVKVTANLIDEFDNHKNSILNLASGNVYTILEIAELVRDKYQEIFRKSCELEVQSGMPEKGEQFRIDSNASRLGFEFSDRKAIEDEVEKIFNLLKQ